MSRSRRKVAKTTWCTGSNTEFYRDRNRNTRAYNKNKLRTLLSTKPVDEVDEQFIDMPNKKNPKYDTWLEPTDGQYVVWKEDEDWWTKEKRNKLFRK